MFKWKTLEFDMFCENFNLANNFWIASSRALMFHMINSSDKTFLWVPFFYILHFFTLWPWPFILGYFLKTLPYLEFFQQWVLEFSYFTWVFLVKRYFYSYQNIFGIAFFGGGPFCVSQTHLVFFFRKLKGKNKAIMGPLLPLTFILGYQYDLAYGSKMERMRGK